MIIIIGSAQEFHAKWVYDALVAQGKAATYFNTLDFPSVLQLSLTPHQPQHPGQLKLDQHPAIALESIQSVYFRYQMGYQVDDLIPPELQATALREIQSAIGCFYRVVPQAKWVNSIESIENHLYKGFQLQLLANAGIRIPKTLITNQPDAVKAFYEECNGNVIFKPVAGGAHAQALTAEDLIPERLTALNKSPVQFQERINGVDIRAYVFGQQLFAAEIQANSLDFRDDPNAPIVKVTLPDHVGQHCLDLVKALGYQYSGIDIKRTPEGEYVFLEGNPCPMFYHFEKVTQYPITQSLINLLLNP